MGVDASLPSRPEHHNHQGLSLKAFRTPEMRFIIGTAFIVSIYIVTLEATPVEAGYMEPRPPALDPLVLEELYERGLLQPVALPAHMEDEGERSKRRWWGNKYKDNKSYGFWITALNKAGNWKKRSYSDY